MLGAFAVFIVQTLVRALRSGVIFSDGVPYDAREQPRMFASMAAIHGSGALLFAWLAVRGDIAGFWSLIGAH
jgi:hypothetical protein